MLSTEWTAVFIILIALLAGYLFVRLPIVRKSFIPGSLAAGILLLVLGPQVAGQYFAEWQIPDIYYRYWSPLPAVLINIVFACLFLARALLPIKKIWQLAAPQAAFGQMIAWGQYALGGLVTLFLLIPIFGANQLSAALIEISFEGGHGTAAGLEEVFKQLSFEEGQGLAVGLATLSLIAALISGMILVHWGQRKKYIKITERRSLSQMVYHRRIIYELRKKGITLREHITPSRLISHLALVGLAILFGWLIHQSLLFIEALTWAKSGIVIFKYLPMFTLCMFGGMLARVVWNHLGFSISRSIIELIGAASLSVLIATAIGTMSLEYISTHLGIFLTLAATGIIWILSAFILFAPRMFRRNWFQNGIVNMAQSMGQTATGILFVKMVDPKDKTEAMESFGYKQLLFEPFVGGGIITALSMPAIILLGLPTFTIIASIVCIAWLLIGLFYFSKL